MRGAAHHLITSRARTPNPQTLLYLAHVQVHEVWCGGRTNTRHLHPGQGEGLTHPRHPGQEKDHHSPNTLVRGKDQQNPKPHTPNHGALRGGAGRVFRVALHPLLPCSLSPPPSLPPSIPLSLSLSLSLSHTQTHTHTLSHTHSLSHTHTLALSHTHIPWRAARRRWPRAPRCSPSSSPYD